LGINSFKLNFADPPPEFVHPERSKVKIVPVPYESTVTYKGGTREGPQSIIQASLNLELWDEELSRESYKIGIYTLAPFSCPSSGPEKAVDELYHFTKRLIDASKFYIFLGGEHSITPGIVKAYKEVYPSLSVLCLDAHADFREVYQGSIYNHACVMRRVSEHSSVVQLGVRSLSKEEADAIKERNIAFQTSFQILQSDKWKKIIDEKLSSPVYITLDVDVLDPSIMPSVGTPEPGGLDWYKILEILKFVFSFKKVVAVDVVEFSPIPGIIAPDFLVAKLVYKIIGYLQI